MMQRFQLGSLGLLFALSPIGGGCPAPECTEEAVVSVEVTVLDEAGGPVPDVEVVYITGSAVGIDCVHLDGGDWACGYEVEGEMIIRAFADGYETAEEMAEIATDECHVLTESKDLVMIAER
jgi:hypothetical protein